MRGVFCMNIVNVTVSKVNKVLLTQGGIVVSWLTHLNQSINQSNLY